MITFKSRNGRLGEVMHLIYGLFYFCIRNDIPLESIVIDKGYFGKAYDSDEKNYAIRDNWPIFSNIRENIVECENFQKFLAENNFQELSNGYEIYQKPIHVDLGKNYVLTDYWHFPYNRKLFHALFKVPRLVDELKRRNSDIDFANACSCHVRRGDFQMIASSPELSKTYWNKKPPTAKEVQAKMIDVWIKKPSTQILVFSDDMDWCKQNLNAKRVKFMEGNKPYEDINLIGMCKEHLAFSSSYFNYMGMMLGD